MDNNTRQGEIYSFWQLLQKQRIEIPIIQRDYAQGRKDKTELRIEFLKALYKSLNEEKPIRLDFIYGNNRGDIFQPLDGQQRLSTLFLLHWYAAVKENTLTEDIQAILIKFSYETRASSREFCAGLVEKPMDIDFSSDATSSFIIDASWFFLSWKKDPTIDAMLRAIDDIHTIFKGMDGLWERITSDTALISFYYVVLENFGLTDDLYIKMNARGKLLTPFENFKAKFQEYIQINDWERDVSFPDSFAAKIDTKWTELFWNHRKMNRIDDAFIRFISAIAMIRIALEKSEDRIIKLRNLQGQPDLVRVEDFTQEGYIYLSDCLGIYCRVYDLDIPLKLNFPFWQHEPEENIFTALVYEGNNASYTQKVLFYAQTEYLQRVSVFNKDKFHDWMRVIRNIVSRGDVDKAGKRPAIIRSPESFDRAIKLVEELAEGCDDIYKFLSTNSISSLFAREQMEEERVKSRLIVENDVYKKVIFLTEDTNFLRGKIDFALYCIDYDKDRNNFDPKKLEGVQAVIKKYLEEEEEITDDLRRGLLTISDDEGMYNYYGYWWSWVYVAKANKRCLLAKYRQLEYFIYGSYKSRDNKPRDYFKQYLKKLLLQLTERSLEDIISKFIPPDNMPSWKVRLIKEPQLLERCKSKYIAIPDDESCCYLLKSMRPRDLADCEKIE